MFVSTGHSTLPGTQGSQKYILRMNKIISLLLGSNCVKMGKSELDQRKKEHLFHIFHLQLILKADSMPGSEHGTEITEIQMTVF